MSVDKEATSGCGDDSPRTVSRLMRGRILRKGEAFDERHSKTGGRVEIHHNATSCVGPAFPPCVSLRLQLALGPSLMLVKGITSQCVGVRG